MITLIVRQTTTDGLTKTWKLCSKNKIHTFGSSPSAELNTLFPGMSGINGIFEFNDGQWQFINLEISQLSSRKTDKPLIISSEKKIQLNECTLLCSPIKNENDLLQNLSSVRTNQNILLNDTKLQIYIVKKDNKILETKVLPLNKTFYSKILDAKFQCTPGNTWQNQISNQITVSQKTIYTEDAARYAKFTTDQVIDKDSKQVSVIVLGIFMIMSMMAIYFKPQNNSLNTMKDLPKLQPAFVKTVIKPLHKKSAKLKPSNEVAIKDSAVAPSQTAVLNNDNQLPGGARISSLMKAVSGGRISQLIGKVSAQGSKSSKLIFFHGVKAGSGNSGRALSAVGSMDRSGHDWGQDGQGTQVVISTKGKGGGKNTSGLGNGLSAGSTGTKAVGLLEEESEITGGLEREVIAQYIRTQLGQILYCYERQLSAHPDLFGKVAVKFTIGPTGSVEKQLIGDSSLKNSTVEGCILNRVATWKFPTPQGGIRVLVTYPFLFKSTN